MNTTDFTAFQKKIRLYYKKNKRSFPWRENPTPYNVVVSEIMLQQTQTSRVLDKYIEFLQKFPNFKSLSTSAQKDVLHAWQGLGYNRRALYLKVLSEIVVKEYKGILPHTKEELIALPGIGKNTAGAIMAFAFNIPTVFIETNIRRVFIYEFFRNKKEVSDKELLPLVEAGLDTKNPRDWYYALMDYGVYLSKTIGNPNRNSKHFRKQSKFEGSSRQARGRIIKVLLQKSLSETTLKKKINSIHFETALDQLLKENIVKKLKGKILLS